MEKKNEVDCKYKKPCMAKDWPEHGYKCETCPYNTLCNIPKEAKIDWPKLFTGWF
jgi:hypothetical protein